MDEFLTLPRLKRLFKKEDIRPKKGLSQSFLIDEHRAEKILQTACLSKQDAVIEVGAGLGELTAGLARDAGYVIAVEIDFFLAALLERRLNTYDNILIKRCDILTIPLDELMEDLTQRFPSWKHLKVVTNLPYSITTQIFTTFLESSLPLHSMTLTMQKEFGERLTAAPGTKSYGAISLLGRYYADIDIKLAIPPEAFYPRPEVDSVVVYCELRDPGRFEVTDAALLFTIIRAGFSKRRKMLRNALRGISVAGGTEVFDHAFAACGIDSSRRAETLSLEEFIALANCVASTIGMDQK